MSRRPMNLSSDPEDANYDPTPSDWHKTLMTAAKCIVIITSIGLCIYFLAGILSK